MTTILRPGDPWTCVPPAGWEPVADVCRAVYEELDEVVARMNSAYKAQISEFQGPGASFTDEDLVWSGSRNVAGFLAGLAEHRPVTPEELRFRQVVGERSAARGFPLKPLVASFHIAYRELWQVLVERAEAAGGRAPKLLLAAGASIWERMHATIDALTEGYEREMARRETLEMRTASQLLVAIQKDPDSADAAALAKEIGFEIDAPFLAIAVADPTTSIQAARAIASSLQPARAVAVPDGSAAIVLVQPEPGLTIDDLLAGSDAQIGIGTSGRGLDAAARSVAEARLALGLASRRQGIVRFEEDWLHALAFAHRDSLERMLAKGIDVARTKPHLVEAVQAYAQTDASIAEGARRLNLSQNSFRYRLDRWQILTGWDPRTHDGMTRSLAALGLAEI